MFPLRAYSDLNPVLFSVFATKDFPLGALLKFPTCPFQGVPPNILTTFTHQPQYLLPSLDITLQNIRIYYTLVFFPLSFYLNMLEKKPIANLIVFMKVMVVFQLPYQVSSLDLRPRQC